MSEPDAPVNPSHPPGWWQASDLQWYPPELHSDPEHRTRYGTTVRAGPGLTERELTPHALDDAASQPSLFDLDDAVGTPRDPGDGVQLGPTNRFRTAAPLWGVGLLALVALVAVAVVLAFRSDGDGDDAPASPASTASETPTERAPDVTATTGVGRPDQPAGLGEVWGWPEWRGTVVDVIDTTGGDLIDPDAAPPPPDRSHVVVLYEATYVGEAVAEFEPFLVDAVGTTVHEQNACLIADSRLAELGVARNRFELVPGQTARFAECLEVDTAAVDGLVVTLTNVNVFASGVAYRAGGDPLPALEPPRQQAGERTLATEPLGTDLTAADWTGAVVDVLDVEAEGLLAGFADPPRDGHRYLAIVFTATNTTATASDFVPLRITGIGREVYEPINGCWLDDTALAERGVGPDPAQVPGGETVTLADCIEVPTDDTGVVIRMEDGLSADDTQILYPLPDGLS